MTAKRIKLLREWAEYFSYIKREVVRPALSIDNWRDFEKQPLCVQREAVMIWFQEGSIYYYYPDEF